MNTKEASKDVAKGGKVSPDPAQDAQSGQGQIGLIGMIKTPAGVIEYFEDEHENVYASRNHSDLKLLGSLTCEPSDEEEVIILPFGNYAGQYIVSVNYVNGNPSETLPYPREGRRLSPPPRAAGGETMESEKLFKKYFEHIGALQRYLRGYFYGDIGIFSNATKEEYGYAAYMHCIAIHTIREIFVEASLGEKPNELADFDDFLWDMAEGNEEKERVYRMYKVLIYPCTEIPPYGIFTYEDFVVAVGRKKTALKMVVEQDEYNFKVDIEKYLKDMYYAWRSR